MLVVVVVAVVEVVGVIVVVVSIGSVVIVPVVAVVDAGDVSSKDEVVCVMIAVVVVDFVPVEVGVNVVEVIFWVVVLVVVVGDRVETVYNGQYFILANNVVLIFLNLIIISCCVSYINIVPDTIVVVRGGEVDEWVVVVATVIVDVSAAVGAMVEVVVLGD